MSASSTTDTATGHTDIRTGTWVDRVLPAGLRPYARLARLDRPIGTWLLLFPGWWAIALAAPAGQWPDWWLMALFAVGAVVMRGAGCTVNDILDRKLDAKVERTRVRPIPAGEVTVFQALGFLGLQLFLGLLVLLQLNFLSILLGVASLVLVFSYPLMKRITWWPQAFLGLTFNWGALMGWTAVKGTLDAPALLLYAGCILWTLGYDTIYAHQDKEDDARVGIKSTALLFGAKSKRWVAGFYAGAFALWLAALSSLGQGWVLAVPLLATGGLLWVQVRGWQVDDPADSLATFKASRFVGWALLVAIMAGVASQPAALSAGGGIPGIGGNGNRMPAPVGPLQLVAYPIR
ncbi:4-hydroxybenzoate octaprenyltransferase [Aerophototrophica crusticola]|uniref:4-hydroxybenzoate octaprenyltransferase n=1 Tax=Aerophototrophica crusticola TaxID=1709002 RepID=A0A858R3Y4_9PROT|nr:4-hydroxybenzoate octaprenyltransferase [Rhodospirillaceae bacterium B3]